MVAGHIPVVALVKFLRHPARAVVPDRRPPPGLRDRTLELKPRRRAPL